MTKLPMIYDTNICNWTSTIHSSFLDERTRKNICMYIQLLFFFKIVLAKLGKTEYDEINYKAPTVPDKPKMVGRGGF